jgi:NADH:ubiquinone oxidoreductase subunit C
MTIEELKQRLGEKIIGVYEKNKQRYYIDIHPKDIVECTRIMFREFGARLATATGIDTPKGFEILYHFSYDKNGKIFTLRVLIEDKKNPEIDSITSVTKAAEWIEREIYEMLGIKFRNHPNLKRLLLSDDFPKDIYPLRQG